MKKLLGFFLLYLLIGLSPLISQSTFTTLTIVNNTPSIEGGATIYDKDGPQTISVFGLGCPDSGCTIANGDSTTWTNVSDQTIGIQWNINRLAPDGTTCDQLCSQYTLDLTACTITLLSGGVCAPNTIPKWSAESSSTIDGSTCSIKITGGTITNNPALCSCKWGAMPCSCPEGKTGGKCTVKDQD